MWVYEKRLQYPVNITQTNAKLAQVIISQFGGPDGELAASQRYLSQRYTMPDGMTKGLLNDIGTEELAHIEIVCAIIYQLTKNLSVEEIKASGFDKYYVDHTLGIWPPEICDPIRFLRQREIVHFQRFGEALVHVQEGLPKNVYAYNPAFDNKKHC